MANPMLDRIGDYRATVLDGESPIRLQDWRDLPRLV